MRLSRGGLLKVGLFAVGVMLASVALADPDVMGRVLHQVPSLSGFDMCHSGGCADVTHVAISEDEWVAVRTVFDPMPENAEQERQALANAIGVIETIVGEKTGTSTDRGGTFGNSEYPGQLDCNDEAINTTNYLRLIRDDGLMHYHTVGDTERRGYFFRGWPHSTASLVEIETKQVYAVDAWFYENGHPAVVLPLATWKSGWKPQNWK